MSDYGEYAVNFTVNFGYMEKQDTDADLDTDTDTDSTFMHMRTVNNHAYLVPRARRRHTYLILSNRVTVSCVVFFSEQDDCPQSYCYRV